ncbi:hypothetical protein [Chelativorans sp. AA-79]|uniref:hypothetical protein n=1 Tax=Chelativorans sp. AA-79 TaxID=3028735 RepID=UPI0023F69AA6|nr:hypothetical protein [Chelativorans sp. AA-79]WEX07365.1 hypothetical protein PVE73_14665 [Chelativorans sp. AA-79]
MTRATTWGVPRNAGEADLTQEQWATRADESLDALLSSQKGSGRPAYAVPGMVWVDDSATPWGVYVYDGTDDILVGYADAANNFFRGKVAKYSAKSGAYVAVLGDNATFFRFSAGATLTLDAASALGADWWCLVKADGGAVTVDPNGPETIDGSPTLLIAQGDSAFIFCDGAAFYTAYVKSTGVSYSAQSLTAAQKGQARANVGADLLGGLRNKVINGNFDFWHRSTNAATREYVADRWRMRTAGGIGAPIYSQSRQQFAMGQTDVPGNPRYFARVGIISGSLSGQLMFRFEQRIEGVETLSGKQVTVTFWAKSTTGTPEISVGYSQDLGTGSGTFTGTGTIGAPVTLNANWQKVSVTGTIAPLSNVTFGTGDYLAVGVNLPLNSVGTTVDIARFSIVEGDATAEADPFSPRHLGQELALCLRYYALFTTLAVTTANTNSSSFPVPMRATPTLTTVTLNAGSGAQYAATAALNGVGAVTYFQHVANSGIATATIAADSEL